MVTRWYTGDSRPAIRDLHTAARVNGRRPAGPSPMLPDRMSHDGADRMVSPGWTRDGPPGRLYNRGLHYANPQPLPFPRLHAERRHRCNGTRIISIAVPLITHVTVIRRQGQFRPHKHPAKRMGVDQAGVGEAGHFLERALDGPQRVVVVGVVCPTAMARRDQFDAQQRERPVERRSARSRSVSL